MHRRALLLSLPLALGLFATGQATALAVQLRVGWEDLPPYQQAGPDGRPIGIDVERCEALLQQAGLRVQWQRMAWARQLISLADGSLDLMLGASRAPEREAYALWTQPYRAEDCALLSMEGAAAPRALAELLGKPLRIGMVRGTSYPGEVQRLLNEPRFQRLLRPLRSVEMGLKGLRTGQLDYLIDDPVVLQQLAQRDGGRPPQVSLWLYRGSARLMLSRRAEAQQPGLLAALDRAIDQLRAQGRLPASLPADGP